MPDKKLTDNEIVKALERCSYPIQVCDECPMPNDIRDNCKCMDTLCENALDLINRQKAEIERLENKVEELSEVLSDTIRIRYAEVKAEAYKECIEKVKKLRGNYTGYAFDKKLDNLLKELVGDNK